MEYLFVKLLPYLFLAFLIGVVVGWYGCVQEDI